MTPTTGMLRSGYTQRSGMVVIWIWTLLLQVGCYSYQPIQTVPPTGSTETGIVLNDRGRALMSDRVGAMTHRIDGRISAQRRDTLTIAVTRVTDLQGNTAMWMGEQVRIPVEGITGYRPRKISKMKSLLLVGAVAAAVVFSLRAALDVFGDPKSSEPGDPPQQS